MKITKTQLKQIIRENLESLPIENLIGGISGLIQGMDPELVGVVFTTVYKDMEGEQPHSDPEPQDEPEMSTPIGFDREPEKASNNPQGRIGFEEALQKIINEELQAVLRESRVYASGEKRPLQIMKDDKGLNRYLQSYIGNMVGNREDPTHDPEEVVKALQSLIGSLSLGTKKSSTRRPTMPGVKTRIARTLQEYVANDRKAQATLNHLSVQEQRILVQVKELMGMRDEEFEELLKDPRRLGDLIGLISQEREMQIAEEDELDENELSRHASGHSSPDHQTLYPTRRNFDSDDDTQAADELASSLYSIVSTLAKAKLKTGPKDNRQWRPEWTKMIQILNYIGSFAGYGGRNDFVDFFNNEWKNSQKLKQDMSIDKLDQLEVGAEEDAIRQLKELEQFLNSYKQLIHPKLHDSFKKELAVIENQPAPAPSGEFRGAKE